MALKDPKTQQSNIRKSATNADSIALPKAETTNTKSEEQKTLRENAYATYIGIQAGNKLLDDLKNAISSLKAPQKEGTFEYHVNHINLNKIELSLPSIKDDLSLPNKHAKSLLDHTTSKNYGEVAKILKEIGDYKKPIDPRLTHSEVEYLKNFTSKDWFNKLGIPVQNEILHSIFIDSKSNNTTKESLIVLTCRPSFDQLTIEEQQKLVLLATKLGEETCRHLTALLNGRNNGESVLLDNDFTGNQDTPGKTLIDNLFKLYNSKFVSGKLDKFRQYDLNDEKEVVVKSFIQELAQIQEIAQESRGTCGPSVPHIFLSWRCPSEMTRLYTDLISIGRCFSKGQNYINLMDDAIPDDKTGRSHSERIFTTALLNDAVLNNAKEEALYSNEYDGYIKPGKLLAQGAKQITLHRETGQTTTEYIYTCKSLLGDLDKTIVPESENKKEQIAEAMDILRSLETYSEDPDFTAISVRWPVDSKDKEAGNHALLALGVLKDEPTKEERLLFRNPHGSTSYPKGTIFVNGVRVENPEKAYYSIPLKNLNEGGKHELRILMHKRLEFTK